MATKAEHPIVIARGERVDPPFRVRVVAGELRLNDVLLVEAEGRRERDEVDDPQHDAIQQVLGVFAEAPGRSRTELRRRLSRVISEHPEVLEFEFPSDDTVLLTFRDRSVEEVLLQPHWQTDAPSRTSQLRAFARELRERLKEVDACHAIGSGYCISVPRSDQVVVDRLLAVSAGRASARRREARVLELLGEDPALAGA